MQTPALPRLLSALLLCTGCSESPASEDPKPGPTTTPTACDAHSLTGTASFVERTAAWGLDQPDARGWVVSSADLDGDGYLDLVAHVPAPNTRGKLGQKKHYSVLMNEANPSGGRRFVDRTAESNYGATRDGAPGELRAATAAVFGDVDNDGDVDALSLTNSGPSQEPPTAADLDRTELLLNDGKGHFELALDAGVNTEQGMPIWGATLVDYDLDGKLDAFMANWLSAMGYTSEQQLYRGDGKGGFSDVSAETGLTDALFSRGATGVTACDVDDDGAPELLVSAYGRMPNLLLELGPDGMLTDRAVAAGYAYDGNVDYHDDQAFLCYCASHSDEPDCAGAGAPLVNCSQVPKWSPGYSDRPESLGGNNFTTVCSDITGDGRLDLYNATIQHWWAGQAADPSALLVNRGDSTFTRPSRQETGMEWEHVGVAWDEGGIDAAAGDLNNDGREEVVVGRSDYNDQYALLFLQLPDGRFSETAKSSGIDHPCAASPILADFDRDGDLDIVMASSRMRDFCAKAWPENELRFYENDASQYGSWFAVRLRGDGVTANRSAIGARVTLVAGGKSFVKEVVGAYGHGAVQEDSVLFFGLGDCSEVESVEVRWPNAAHSVERWETLGAKRLVELVMGDPAVHEPLAAP